MNWVVLVQIGQTALTVGVLLLTWYNSTQHTKTLNEVLLLKVYIHENFVTKGEAAAAMQQLNQSTQRLMELRK